jgi:hypothetical protein
MKLYTEYTHKSEYKGYTETNRYFGTTLITKSGELVETVNGCKIYRVTAEEIPTNRSLVYYDTVRCGVILDRANNIEDAKFVAKLL